MRKVIYFWHKLEVAMFEINYSQLIHLITINLKKWDSINDHAKRGRELEFF